MGEVNHGTRQERNIETDNQGYERLWGRTSLDYIVFHCTHQARSRVDWSGRYRVVWHLQLGHRHD